MFIYFMSSYFLKKDTHKNKDLQDNNSNMNFDKYINLKTKYVKIFFNLYLFFSDFKIYLHYSSRICFLMFKSEGPMSPIKQINW